MDKHLNIGLENFRVFKNLAEFEFAPITILTGANSAGKSSIIKGIMMMEEFLKNQELDHFYFKNPEIDFKDKLKILGSFDSVINEPNEKYITFKICNEHKYFGDYYILFKFCKYGKIKGKLTHLSIYFDNAKETIYSFEYEQYSEEKHLIHPDVHIEKDQYYWFSQINYSWLALQIRDITFDVKESARLWEIYKAYLNVFEKEYGDGMLCVEAKFFIPDITHEFAIFLKEKEFDFVSFRELNEKLSFLRGIKSNSIAKKGSAGRSYYTYLIQEDIDFENGFFVPKPILDILHLLGENYNAYTFYNKMLEIYPELQERKDELLEDCELVFAEKIILADGCRSIDTNFLSVFSKLRTVNSVDRFRKEIEVPILEIENMFNDISNSRRDTFGMLYRFFWKYLSVSGTQSNLHYFLEFADSLLSQDLLKRTSELFSNITYIETNRAEMKRSYEFDGKKNSFNLFVRDFFEKEYKYKHLPVHKEDKLQIVNHWLKEFEIADKMEVDINEDGDSAKIFLCKNGTKRNIADLGYGTTQLLPLLMYVAQFAVNNGAYFSKYSSNGREWKPTSVGCAVEQYGDQDEYPYTICVEEPETNLHPMMQAKLADFFVFCAKELKIRFIIETHSEALIRKLQYLTAKDEITTQDSIIYYIGNSDSAKRAKDEEQVRTIRIKPNGQLSQPFGSGFTDEATKWIKEMFAYSNKN